MMRNKPEDYFVNDDFVSLESFNKVLWELSSVDKNSPTEHQRRAQIAAELIEKIKSDDGKSKEDKLAFLNAAIVHPAFSSRLFGALKRGLNSIFSGQQTTENFHPYFLSSSQMMLIQCRDKMQKESHGLDDFRP